MNISKEQQKKDQENENAKILEDYIQNLISNKKEINLNLGCGSDIREGWVNIDEFANTFCGDKKTISQNNLIKYDCRNGLPIQDNTVDIIYSSHFFEHLIPNEAFKLYKDSFRVLKKDGIFRIVLPDITKIIKAIFKDDDDYLTTLINDNRTMFRLENKPNPIDFLNYIIYQNYEHKYIYNPQKVIDILNEVGFSKILETTYDSKYDINNELRKKYSFYIKATK